MNNEVTTHPAFATPMALLQQAVAGGASIEMLRELLALKREVETDNARKAYYDAFAIASAELPAIIKTKKVDFTSPKGRTNYRYEALDDVVEAVRPVLGRHGLAHSWEITEQQDRLVVTCRITHKDGFSTACTLSAPRDESGNKNFIQGKGSTITYLQRYTLKSALGLAASLDDDGQASGSGAGAKASAPARISAEQAAQIAALLTAIAAPNARDLLLQKVKVAAIEEIPADLFERSLAFLKAAKERETTQTNGGSK